MTDDDTFPRWMYGPEGQSEVFHRAADVPAGWVDHPGKLPTEPARIPDPLDHDGDGVKGGSLKGVASTAAKGAARRGNRR